MAKVLGKIIDRHKTSQSAIHGPPAKSLVSSKFDRPVEHKQVRSVGLASVGMGPGPGGNEMRVAAHQAGHHGGRHQELHQRDAQPLIEHLD